MTVPEERPLPDDAEAGWETDPEIAEAYAEEVGVDPSPEQIDAYLDLEGQPPLAEQVAPDEG